MKKQYTMPRLWYKLYLLLCNAQLYAISFTTLGRCKSRCSKK